jgi:hypothetical protein
MYVKFIWRPSWKWRPSWMSRDIFRPTSLLKFTWSKDNFLKVSCLYHNLHYFDSRDLISRPTIICHSCPILRQNINKLYDICVRQHIIFFYRVILVYRWNKWIILKAVYCKIEILIPKKETEISYFTYCSLIPNMLNLYYLYYHYHKYSTCCCQVFMCFISYPLKICK